MDEHLTSEERLLAAVAHAGILVPITGIIAPLLIWLTQRERSPKVKFHAIQATAYQALPVLALIIYMGCFMCAFGFTMLAAMFPASSGDGALIAFANILPMLIFFAVLFIFMIYGIVGAVRVFQGADFRYVMIGRWLERYLARDRAEAGAEKAEEAA